MDAATTAHAEELIAELAADPERFEQGGKINALLQDYFRGYPVGTLRPLLTHPNAIVRRTALWVAAELPQRASGLIDCILPFLADPNAFERQRALETVFLCAKGEDLDKIVHVFRALEDADPNLRRKAMSLLVNAGDEQLAAPLSLQQRLGPSKNLHAAGITVVVQKPPLEAGLMVQLIAHEEPLFRRYGAIAAARNWETRALALEAAEASPDEDVREFAALARKRTKMELELRRSALESVAREAPAAGPIPQLDAAALLPWLNALATALGLVRDLIRSGDTAEAEELADAFAELPALLASGDRSRLDGFGERAIAPLLWRRPQLVAQLGGLVGAGRKQG